MSESINRIIQVKTPGTMLFGVGARKKLPQQAKGLSEGPFLIVTDSGLVKAGVVKEIEGLMSGAGFKVSLFDEVEPDPEVKVVGKCVRAIDSTGARAVIGIGGGSSMDIAKTASAMAGNSGNIMDYAGIGKLPCRGLPFMLLPTTAGTGSEVTPIAVLSDKEQHLKIGIVSQHLYTDVAIVDPALTLSCPPNVTAASGMDTLVHAIEVYTNRFSVEIIDTLALEAIRLVGQHLRRSVRSGRDLAARQGMSLACLYAGLGLGPVNTAAVHALAYPLGGMYNIPHGLANSILLPHVLEFNLPACELKFARAAEALGVKDAGGARGKAGSLIEMVINISRDIGIPEHLRDIGVPEDTIPEMAVAAMKVTRLLKNNPREVALEDAKSIYKHAY